MFADATTTLEYIIPQEVISAVASKVAPRSQWVFFIPPDSDSGTSENQGFGAHYAKLHTLVTSPELWPNREEPPSSTANEWAQLVLQHFQEISLLPTRVVASTEGGVAVCFIDGNRYADVECLNSGAILGVISNKRDRPFVWEIEPTPRDIADATFRIREFFNTRQTSPHGPKWTPGR